MTSSGETTWFRGHYDGAAAQIVEFLAGDGISLEGREVADIGCGDGITDLGLVRRADPARLTGFDVNATDLAYLRRRAAEEGVGGELPDNLEFVESTPTGLPAANASYDVVITWSAFEHVREPISVLAEARRILRPDGVFFLQLWPFFHSDRGSHLWDWFSDPFPHLTHTEDELAAAMRASGTHGNTHTEYMLNEFRHLNRVTVDELQQTLLAAGLGIRKLELMTNPVHIPEALMRFPVSKLGITGVKLLAVPLR